ncbi:uncharacterized protein [Nicotiana tomentosiformis]|uniref:uncharacterized protein isoform X2 n=1 Tax=Nicotiana tomentosiformis TaxID=4098 RepID=UPI00051BAB65|nr:uncharacterized protein LOC117277243 isoform X2 [Nicotiana tomentosiformis]
MVGPIVSTRKYQGQILRGRLRNIMAKDGPRWRKTCYQCIRGFYSDNVQSFDSISSSSSDAIELDMAMVFVYLQVIHRSPSNSNIGTEVYCNGIKNLLRIEKGYLNKISQDTLCGLYVRSDILLCKKSFNWTKKDDLVTRKWP